MIPLRKRFYPLLLALLILVVTWVQLRWILQDERYQPFVDPYPQQALIIADHLSTHGLADLPQLVMETRIGPRSPLYQFGAALFVLMFGRSLDAMLGLNLLLNGLMLVGAFSVGRLIKNEQTGLLAALLVASLPPIMQLTRIIRPHSVLPALMMLWLWLLLRLFKHHLVRDAWLFCLVLLLMFWLHPNAIYIVLPPTLLFLLVLIFARDGEDSGVASGGVTTWRVKVKWVWGRLQRPFILKGLLPGLLVAGLLAAAWYVAVLKAVMTLTEVSSSSWATEQYGFPDVAPSFFWYLQTMPGAISNFIAYLFGLGCVAFLFGQRPYRLLLSLTVVLMYLGIGLRQGTLAWMNFAAVLPVVGVITAVFVMDLASVWDTVTRPAVQRIGRVVARGLVGAVVVVAIFNIYMVTTSQPGENTRQLAALLGAPLDHSCGWRMIAVYCPNAPRQQDWQELAILQAVLKDSGCPNAACTLAVVTESSESFGFASLRYFMVEAYPAANLDIMPIRKHGRYSVDWLKTDYLVYIPQMQNNAYSNAIIQFLQAPPEQAADAFEQIAHFSLPRAWEVRVLRRIRPISDEEIALYLAELDVAAHIKGSSTLHNTFRGEAN